MKPWIGQTVHYVALGSADGRFPSVCRAAKVAAVTDNTTVDLVVMNPTGLFFNQNVQASFIMKNPGTWHFIEDKEKQ